MNPILTFAAIIGATFIFEDPTTLWVGSMIAKQEITFLSGFTALSIGIFLGDLGLYVVGLLLRKKVFTTKRTLFTPVTAQIVMARFLPGARTVTFLASGHSQYPLPRFLLIIFPSSIIWTLLLLLFTEQVFTLFHFLPFWGNWVIGIILLVILSKAGSLVKG